MHPIKSDAVELIPSETEPICLISYEIAHILLGGGPDSRPSFWKAYRRELALNQKTNYKNYHVHLCRDHLGSFKVQMNEPVYFRNERLTIEKPIGSQVRRLSSDSIV